MEKKEFVVNHYSRVLAGVLSVLGCLAWGGLNARAAEQPKISALNVYPPTIQLDSKTDIQRIVVTATREDGVTLDVTKQAAVSLNADCVRVENSTLFPVSDGQAQLEVAYEGLKVNAPVVVKNADVTPAINFNQDLMPIFLRTGCNTGSCHGAARGKDGFRLSIFGFDPAGDYQRITRELGARRINLAVPGESLLVEKSVGAVPHTGGKRFDYDSEANHIFLSWLEAGAPAAPADTPTVDRVELFPPNAVLEGADTTQQFIVRAHYSDGTDRDVTTMALFMSNNDNSAPVNETGVVTAAARGEAFVMVRFDAHTVVSQVIVLPENLQYEAPPSEGNYIDQFVNAKLEKLRILPSGLCTDEEYLRRATIDVTGKLPTEEEFVAFMADTSPDKRAKLINQLLERKEFSEIWAMKWAELLMIKSSNQVSYKSAFLYNSWLTDQIANEVPLNEMVRSLLGASGGTFKEPATNYYQIERDTLKTSENVVQVFMGIRMQCAQCHNHPFDRWTMDDYYSFAAFFAQIGRKTGEDYRETIIYNRGAGGVRHIVSKKDMAPKFLGGDTPDVKGKDRRAVMAEWLTADENPYFSTNVANRIWAHFLGAGIVEPIDDVRVSNPSSNPELMAELGRKLIEYKYDFKKMVRDVCASRAYQRSAVRNASNATDELNFAHAKVRRIPAEMLLDCLSQVTETKDKFRGLPLGARAVQIADGRTSNYFLTTFGRSTRGTVCACEVKTEPTLSQSLHLLNGTTIESKIGQGGVVKQLLDAKKTTPQVIESLYIRALSRRPNEAELAKLTKIVEESKDQRTGLRDIFWAVLNSREFLFSH